MRKKILIVDDEPDEIVFVSTLLEENGYATISAMDGVDGFEKACTERPDLVLLDILMPRRGGIEMYKHLRKNADTAGIPVVIVTGVSKDRYFEGAMFGREGLGRPNGYIDKPVNPDAMLKLVDRLLS